MTRIVAVHGNGGGSTRFDTVADLFPPGVSFEAIDLPGFNGVPVDPSLVSVADYADHLAGLLSFTPDTDGGQERPVVLGHGIGGSIALDLASRRPELLAGLILHAPVGADLDTRLFPKIMSTPPVRELIRRLIAAKPLRPIWRRLFFPTGGPRAVLDTFFEGYRSCESFGQMFEIIDAPWFEALTPVTELPTALLWGEHDRVLKSGQTDSIRSKAPNARIVIEPGWDHFPMIEQPQEYAVVVAQLAHGLATPQS
jgi:pimeloyl-ACP methyl ester carboxylesterase